MPLGSGHSLPPAAALAQAAASAKRPPPPRRRIVAARVADLPIPSKEPLGGLSLEDFREFFGAMGAIERLSCSPFPRIGPAFVVDVLVQYRDPATAEAAVATFNGASMTGGSRCTLTVALFASDEVPVDADDPLSWESAAASGAGSSAASPPGVADEAWGRDSGEHVADEAMGARRVVLAHIEELAQPDSLPLGGLTMDLLHSIFSEFGTVEKIACSTTPRTGRPLQTIDAMVQFATNSMAAAAVQVLDGHSLIKDGFFSTEAKFSRHTELRARANSERTRVYVGSAGVGGSGGGTNSPAPTPGRAPAGHALRRFAVAGPVGAAPVVVSRNSAAPAALVTGKRVIFGTTAGALPESKRARLDGPVADDRRVLLAHITELSAPLQPPLGGFTVDDIHAAFSPHGVVEKIACKASPKSGPIECVDAMVQFQSPAAAALALQLLDGTSLTGDGCSKLQCRWSRHTELTAHGDSNLHRDYTGGARDYTGGAAGVGHSQGPPPCPRALSHGGRDCRGSEAATPVAAVFNLPEEMAEADILFNLFSLYGYVGIVKVVFKRPRETALVQFSEPGFVDLAIERLSGAPLLGKAIEIRRSKQSSIRCTEVDQASPERTTRSYTMSDQFWSKKDYERIGDNAAAPSRTLFVKNIAPQLSEQDLVDIFAQHGVVEDFAFLPCPPTHRYKTAAVQMATVPEAVQAVALAQREHFANAETGEEMRLLVNFSKKDGMPRNAVRSLPWASRCAVRVPAAGPLCPELVEEPVHQAMLG